jgi:hypothetical protein
MKYRINFSRLARNEDDVVKNMLAIELVDSLMQCCERAQEVREDFQEKYY